MASIGIIKSIDWKYLASGPRIAPLNLPAIDFSRSRTMLGIGRKFPEYRLNAVVSTDQAKAFQTIDGGTHAGKWRVVFFWPMDFTFVCPTEIAEFGRRNKDFVDRNAQVLGVSTDTQYVHL